ncbi:hypothetical protein IW492_12110 [Enterococcus sp. BWB1-3]|uniref:hypothetical protein n=1 Tax=unclassified Enterococcus TaxID=2608891 RepID=UPI001921712F|nr:MULTISPECIES: hypothetical protein [unclassified Enterococcus]MBL1229978.1 hypothetical protein [Enterococcus sp. BWB1-3]MCB5952975.1 hypothetical protein [Enterococcus sp. BWT-B8]MCB5953526.1 hypothetical protein [Enterococcus sp. CWB-B31]
MLNRTIYNTLGKPIKNDYYKFRDIPWYVDCDCGKKAERKANKEMICFSCGTKYKLQHKEFVRVKK